ncbi:MAG: hypothetical protein AAF416_17685 [Pseudomonadota bacterium]
MTSDKNSTSAWDDAVSMLKAVKGTWLLITFFVGALFWARDTVEVYHHLPGVVAQQAARIEALEKGHCPEGSMTASLVPDHEAF